MTHITIRNHKNHNFFSQHPIYIFCPWAENTQDQSQQLSAVVLRSYNLSKKNLCRLLPGGGGQSYTGSWTNILFLYLPGSCVLQAIICPQGYIINIVLRQTWEQYYVSEGKLQAIVHRMLGHKAISTKFTLGKEAFSWHFS